MPPPTNRGFLKAFVSGEAHLGFWSYIKKGVGLLDSYYILRSLTLYQFGVYQLLLAIYAIVSDIFHDLFATVVGNDVVRHIGASNESKAKKLFREYAIFRLLMTIPPLAISFIVAPQFEFRYGPEAILWLRLLSLLFVVDTATRLATALLNFRLEFRVLASRPTIQKLIQLGILASFYYFGGLGLTEIFLAQLVAPAITLALLSPAVRRSLTPWRGLLRSPETLFLKIITSYGRWEIPQIILRDFIGKVRPFLIKLFLGTEAVGVYSVAATAVSLLKDTLPMRTLTALVPRRAHDRPYLQHLLVYGTKYYTLFAFVVSCVGAALFPIAIIWLFPEFRGSIPLFYIMLPIVVVFAFTKLIAIFLLVQRRQKFMFFQSFMENIIGAGLLLAFLPVLGLYGAALAALSADIITDSARYLYLVRTKFIDPYPWKRLFTRVRADDQIMADVKREVLGLLRIKKLPFMSRNV